MSEPSSFIACAKRMGAVLLGRTEASVQAVMDVAGDLYQSEDTLREVWNETLKEPIPAVFMNLLTFLVEDDRHAAH